MLLASTHTSEGCWRLFWKDQWLQSNTAAHNHIPFALWEFSSTIYIKTKILLDITFWERDYWHKCCSALSLHSIYLCYAPKHFIHVSHVFTISALAMNCKFFLLIQQLNALSQLSHRLTVQIPNSVNRSKKFLGSQYLADFKQFMH